MKLEFYKKKFLKIANKRASYCFANKLEDFIDFEVKRIYFIQDCKEATGQHCHKEEDEFFIMIKGSSTAIIDRGNGKEDILLEDTGDGIYVGKYVWHGFKNFSKDAILLALSSTNYHEDRSDYVEDYEEYKKIITN